MENLRKTHLATAGAPTPSVRIANETPRIGVHQRSRSAGGLPDVRAGAREQPMRVRLRPDLAVLSVRGDDARAWLNGQITNDVRTTQPGDAVQALVLNVKGRILADAIVVDRGERGLGAIIPRSEHDALRTHLEKYVIMEDVELVLEETLDVAELHGASAAAVSGEQFAVKWMGQDVAIWIGDANALAGIERIDDAEAELARIRAGRPAFGIDFGPTTYPQEAGLERAVSFQKGCYLGQEVVCMLENRGQLSRALVRIETEQPVSAGAKVVDASGAEVGAVTSAVGRPEGGSVGLAYVKRAAIVDGRGLTVDGVETRAQRV